MCQTVNGFYRILDKYMGLHFYDGPIFFTAGFF